MRCFVGWIYSGGTTMKKRLLSFVLPCGQPSCTHSRKSLRCVANKNKEPRMRKSFYGYQDAVAFSFQHGEFFRVFHIKLPVSPYTLSY